MTTYNPQAPTARQYNAIQKAHTLGLAAKVQRIRYGIYEVPSTTRDGVLHTVTVRGQDWTCSCEAGMAGQPCCHAAAVLIRKIEAAGAGVTGPTATSAPAPAPVVRLAPRRVAL